MGLLEDLERQAEQRRREEELDAAELARRQEYFRGTVRPAVGRAYEYIRELFSHLEYLKPDKSLQYTIPRYGEIEAKLDTHFKVRVSKDDTQATINVETSAEIPLPSSPEVQQNTERQVLELEEFLSDHQLKAKQVTQRDSHGHPKSAVFRVYGTLYLSGEIKCTELEEEVSFEFVNFDRLGSVRRQFRAEQMNDAFFDRLGRYLIRDDDDFLRDVIDDGDREQIRQEIRKQERSGAVLREHDKDPREGLLNQIRSLWYKPD